MSTFTPIMRLTTEAMDALRSQAQQYPELWQDPATDFGALLESLNIPNYAEPTELLASGKIEMPSAEQYSFKAKADRHALQFLENIPDIAPSDMADAQLLTWLSCFHLLEFGISRWPLQAGANPTKHALDHYLPERGRPITDASVAGRTLWVAETAKRAAADGRTFTAEEALEHFSNNPMVDNVMVQMVSSNGTMVNKYVTDTDAKRDVFPIITRSIFDRIAETPQLNLV